MRIAVNVIVVYAAWFATALAAASDRPWLAAGASLTAVIINIALARRWRTAVQLIAIAGIVGLVVETILISNGCAGYAAPGPIAGLPPAWLVLMWMSFATMLNASLAWLNDRLLLAAVLGGVGGALAYYAGARLGALELREPIWLSLSAIGALWAIAFTALVYVAGRLRRDRRKHQ